MMEKFKNNADYDGMGDFSRFGTQGKSKKNYSDSGKLASLAGLGLVLTIAAVVIDNLLHG